MFVTYRTLYRIEELSFLPVESRRLWSNTIELSKTAVIITTSSTGCSLSDNKEFRIVNVTENSEILYDLPFHCIQWSVNKVGRVTICLPRLPDTSKETAYSLFVGLPSIGCKTIPETPSTTSINHLADAVEPVHLIGFVKSYGGERFPHLCYLWSCWFSYTSRLFLQIILYSTHWKIPTNLVTNRKREKLPHR